MDVIGQYSPGHRSDPDCKPQPLYLPHEQEDAITLAGSKRVVTTPTVSRADPRHVREGARSSSPTVHEYDNPICDTNMPTGGLKGNIPRAIGANTARDTRYGVIADGQDKPIRGVHGDSVHSPVSSHCGHGSRAGLAGSGGGSSAGRAVGGGGPGVACRRLKAHSQVAPNGRSTDKEEEDRLVASIARLDTLLREENGDADDLNASQNKLGCSNLVSRGRTGSLKARGEMERKPTRVPVGGISKSRVRGGSGKETKNCSSTKPVPTAVQKTGVNHGLPVKRVVSSIPAIGGARDVADATTSISPGMFPSLFCQVQTGSADRGERGRYILADASAAGENGLMREEAAHTAHGRVASPMPYRFTAREGQWQTGRRDDGFVEVVNEHQYCENNRRDFTPACWGTHNNDRYGNSAIDPPRYTVHGEKDWPQQPPSSQGRHRDARSGDDPEGLHGDIGGARGYPGDRVAAIGSRGVHPTALGLERGGSTGWDRCDACYCAFQPSAETRSSGYASRCAREAVAKEKILSHAFSETFRSCVQIYLAHPSPPVSNIHALLTKRFQSYLSLLYFSVVPLVYLRPMFSRTLASSLFRIRIERYIFCVVQVLEPWVGRRFAKLDVRGPYSHSTYDLTLFTLCECPPKRLDVALQDHVWHRCVDVDYREANPLPWPSTPRTPPTHIYRVDN